MARKTSLNLEPRHDMIITRAMKSGFFKDQTSVFNYALELLNRDLKLGVNGDTFTPSTAPLEVASH